MNKNKLLLFTAFAVMFSVHFCACSSVKKALKEKKTSVVKSESLTKDSVGRMTVEVVSTDLDTASSVITIDSAYDKVVEETITEMYMPADGTVIFLDEGYQPLIKRETKRTIKEKGKKVLETIAQSKSVDSTRIASKSVVKEREQKESANSVKVETKEKDVARKSFLPWWLWLLAVCLLMLLGALNRIPLIRFINKIKSYVKSI